MGAAGLLAWWSDDFEGARQYYVEALPLARERADPRREMEALYNLAFVAAWNDAEGPDVAERLLHESLALAERLGDLRAVARAHAGLGFVLVVVLQAAGSRPVISLLLFLIAALEGERGRHARAARLWGGAESAREVTGVVRPPTADHLMGDPMAAARKAIGDEAVDRSLAEGRAMDLDAAIAYAYEED